jgi:predicted nucleic acid-binding protein
MTSTVLLDTNVFSAWLRPHSTLIPRYAKHVFGNRVAIAFQTVAEVRYGAITAGWGEKRIEAVERLIKRTVVLPPDDKTAWAVARLRAECRAGGHPLHQKAHAGDLWIAATAIRWQVPLVAHDAVFLDCPGLELRTEIDD